MTAQYHIADLFDITSAAVPERLALVTDSASLTYAELAHRTSRLAAGFAELGIKRGDHVGLYLYNSIEYVEAFLALVKLGAVPFNINYRYRVEELRYLLDNANAVGLVYGAEFSSTVADLKTQLPQLKVRVVVGEPDVNGKPYNPLLDSAADIAFERSEEDYLLLYTGGTTGMPKGVMWPHKSFFFACLGGGGHFHPAGPVESPEAIAERATGGYALRLLTVAPLMHGAAIWTALSCLLGGLTLVLDESTRFDPEHLWTLVERHQVNVMQIVGDAMAIPLRDALRDHPGRWQLAAVVGFGSGGAVFSSHVKRDIEALLPNVTINDGMGSSETGVAGAAQPSPDGMMRIDATPVQQVIVDERLGTVGELGLVGRAGHIPLGYYNDPEKTAETFRTVAGQRWVVTGDAGRLDDDGKITLFGRGSTCINSGGEKIYPEEVEEVLREHPDVFDAVVTYKADNRWGQRVVAILSCRDGASRPSDDTIKAFAAERLAGYKVPREYLWVDAVKRSPAGKQDYKWAQGYAEAFGA